MPGGITVRKDRRVESWGHDTKTLNPSGKLDIDYHLIVKVNITIEGQTKKLSNERASRYMRTFFCGNSDK